MSWRRRSTSPSWTRTRQCGQEETQARLTGRRDGHHQLAVSLAAALPRGGLGERALPRQIYLLPPCSRGARLASSLSYAHALQARARQVEVARPLSSCFSRQWRAQASTAHAPRACVQLALSLRLVGEPRPRSASLSRRRHRASLLDAVVRSRPCGTSPSTPASALSASPPRRTSYDRFSPVCQQVVDCLRQALTSKRRKRERASRKDGLEPSQPSRARIVARPLRRGERAATVCDTKLKSPEPSELQKVAATASRPSVAPLLARRGGRSPSPPPVRALPLSLCLRVSHLLPALCTSLSSARRALPRPRRR